VAWVITSILGEVGKLFKRFAYLDYGNDISESFAFAWDGNIKCLSRVQ